MVRDQEDIRKLLREGIEFARGWRREEGDGLDALGEGSPPALALLVGEMGEGRMVE